MPLNTGSQIIPYLNANPFETQGEVGTAADWILFDSAAQGNIDSERSRIEYVNRKNGGQTQFLVGVFSEAIQFDVAVDYDDPSYNLLLEKYNAGLPVGLAVLLSRDAAVTPGIGVSGTEGLLVANCFISTFGKDLSQDGVAEVTIDFAPTSNIIRDYSVA